MYLTLFIITFISSFSFTSSFKPFVSRLIRYKLKNILELNTDNQDYDNEYGFKYDYEFKTNKNPTSNQTNETNESIESNESINSTHIEYDLITYMKD